MFGWLERRGKRAADDLIAEGNRAEQAADWAGACALYRRAVAAAPRYARAYLNLGIALEALGDAAGAMAAHEAALAAAPTDPYASYNLAKLLVAQGAASRAQPLLERALHVRPDFPEALLVLGCAFLEQGKPAAALSSLERALERRPADFGTLFHYARALRSLERLAETRAALERALALQPDNVEARAALADVLSASGDVAGSVAALEAVLALRPDWADALYNYGCMLRKQQRLEEAETALQRAIAADPRHARAYQILGGVLLAQGRSDEALELYAAGQDACPQDLGLYSAELFALLCTERISEEERFERHRAFGRRIEGAVAPLTHAFPNPRHADKRLRIGYLSAEFCYHVITLSTLPLLEHHDRSRCEIYCYSTTEVPDAYTAQLQSRADHWRAWRSVADAEIAQAIARDGIDILVDLAGHSGISHLAVMARRPAPVQATWLGYLGTTGLTRIDYRLSDPVADPSGLTERYHSEALARLPRTQWCWRPFVTPPHAPQPPCLANGHATFGSFHGAMKLSRASRRLWAEIMREVKDARLVLLGVPKGRAQHALLADLGVAPERVTMLPYVSIEDYMRWYDAVDVVLDPTPYSGANTTCDALFMGVPVLTAPGARSASRSAASVLTSVGLQECIASDAADYVARAAAFARSPERLRELRGSLRGRLRASPLMDEHGFVRELEDAYRRMWRRWCSGEAPQGW